MRMMLGAAVAALLLSAGSADALTTYKGNVLVTDNFVVGLPLNQLRPVKFVMKVTSVVFDYLAVKNDYDLSGVRYENGVEEGYYMGPASDLVVKFAPGQTTYSETFVRPRPAECNVFEQNHCLLYSDESLVISGFRRGTGTARVSYYLTPVPEPSTWALMITGFGLAGAALRMPRRRLA